MLFYKAEYSLERRFDRQPSGVFSALVYKKIICIWPKQKDILCFFAFLFAPGAKKNLGGEPHG
jgi:hypothetical protein